MTTPLLLVLGAGLLSRGLSLIAQAVPPPSTTQQSALPAISRSPPTEALRPVLNRISEMLAGLNVGRWKAPGEVRSVTQRDIDSIQRDLSATLPPLLDQANTEPVSVASSFSVYRNIDAVYDVLLRVSETAVLAGPQNEADGLQTALARLESARRDLGDAILRLAGRHEQELQSLRAAVAQATASVAANPAPPTKTVVNDGPATTSKAASAPKRRKKPPVSANPTPIPSPATSQVPPPQ